MKQAREQQEHELHMYMTRNMRWGPRVPSLATFSLISSDPLEGDIPIKDTNPLVWKRKPPTSVPKINWNYVRIKKISQFEAI